jgi:zinc protease
VSQADGATAPALRRLGLDNGVTLILAEHAAADVAAIQAWVRAGARDEAEAESGFSHLVEHLLFKGTGNQRPGAIDQTISGLGGEINAATSQDFTYYHVVLPARSVEMALDVLSDAVRNAAFDPAEVERERQVILEEIRRSEDNPSARLWRVLTRQHFGAHPYGRPVLGTPESIRGATRERVVEYYRRHYVPENVTVVVVGRIDLERTAAWVRDRFATWTPRPVPACERRSPRSGVGVRRAEEPRAVQEVYLGVAWPGPVVPDPDVYAVELLAAVLGSGRASRLPQALRERRALVSSIGASAITQREAGTISVRARTTAALSHAVEPALLEEIAALQAAGVDDAELRRARTTVEAGYAFGYETAEGVARAYGLAETVFSLEFELTYLDAVARVTPEGIRATARRYLTPDRFTAATLVPRDGAA